MLPPSGYDGYLPVIDRVFGSGIAPYVHPTGFDAYRFITGFNGPIDKIDPLWTPANPARGLTSGNWRLFTTDHRPSALLEVFQHSGNGAVPPGSYELQFRVTGSTLNHNLILDSEYRALFSRHVGDGDDHRFSQCVDYYMETQGCAKQFDTHSWLTVAGAPHGCSGYVHAWKQNLGQITPVNVCPYIGG